MFGPVANSFIRAAFSAALTALAIAFSHQYKKLAIDAQRWLLLRLFHGTKMTVDEMIIRGELTDANAVYSGLEWFLSRRHERGSFTIGRRERSKTPITTVLPEPNVTHSFTDEGDSMKYRIMRDETTTGSVRRHIEVEGKSVASLLAFVKRVEEAFEKHKAEEARKISTHVHRGDKWEAVHRVRPPTNTLSKPSRISDHVILAAGMCEEIERDVAAFLSGEADYARMGQAWKRGFMFHGVPGTGKTSVARAIAMVHRLDVYVLALGSVASDVELSRLINNLPATKHILLLEDVDCCRSKGIVMERRRRSTPPDVASNVAATGASPGASLDASLGVSLGASLGASLGVSLAAVLNTLDGIVCANGRLIVMTSNHVSDLDEAFLRPRRGVDRSFEFGVATRDQVERMFARFYPDKECPDISSLVGASPAAVCAAVLAHRDDPVAAISAVQCM